ncbi:DNA mismatch repair protein PMS1 [Pelomyxa schiedti]|nr:DNA mismatch repair protein PMS1 [Pelomyxa schiedti]
MNDDTVTAPSRSLDVVMVPQADNDEEGDPMPATQPPAPASSSQRRLPQSLLVRPADDGKAGNAGPDDGIATDSDSETERTHSHPDDGGGAEKSATITTTTTTTTVASSPTSAGAKDETNGEGGNSNSSSDNKSGGSRAANCGTAPAGPDVVVGGGVSGGGRIRGLPASTVRAIKSGQVITDTKAAIKELLENSLDAGASYINIRLEGNGADLISVSDNGHGIGESDLHTCCIGHHTSKIEDYHSLDILSSYGFRGEALHSLCSVSTLEIETRTQESTLGQHVTYTNSGAVSSSRDVPIPVGTKITAHNLYGGNPVRRRMITEQCKTKSETKKIHDLVLSYILICPTVHFHVEYPPSKPLIRESVPTTAESLLSVYGPFLMDQLSPVDFTTPDGCLRIVGFLPKPKADPKIIMRSVNDRFFLYVNKRPIDLPRLAKLLFQHMRKWFLAAKQRYPFVILDEILSPNLYDVNLTPDKRKIFFKDEDKLLRQNLELLNTLYPTTTQAACESEAEVPSTQVYVSTEPKASPKPPDHQVATTVVQLPDFSSPLTHDDEGTPPQPQTLTPTKPQSNPISPQIDFSLCGTKRKASETASKQIQSTLDKEKYTKIDENPDDEDFTPPDPKKRVSSQSPPHPIPIPITIQTSPVRQASQPISVNAPQKSSGNTHSTTSTSSFSLLPPKEIKIRCEVEHYASILSQIDPCCMDDSSQQITPISPGDAINVEPNMLLRARPIGKVILTQEPDLGANAGTTTLTGVAAVFSEPHIFLANLFRTEELLQQQNLLKTFAPPVAHSRLHVSETEFLRLEGGEGERLWRELQVAGSAPDIMQLYSANGFSFDMSAQSLEISSHPLCVPEGEALSVLVELTTLISDSHSNLVTNEEKCIPRPRCIRQHIAQETKISPDYINKWIGPRDSGCKAATTDAITRLAYLKHSHEANMPMCPHSKPLFYSLCDFTKKD